jgi:hypothetical protein
MRAVRLCSSRTARSIAFVVTSASVEAVTGKRLRARSYTRFACGSSSGPAPQSRHKWPRTRTVEGRFRSGLAERHSALSLVARCTLNPRSGTYEARFLSGVSSFNGDRATRGATAARRVLRTPGGDEEQKGGGSAERGFSLLPVDVDFQMRMKGALEAAAAMPTGRPGQGHAEAYPRIRAEVAAAIGANTLADELDRLFPAELSTAGRPFGAQGEEAIVLMNQLAGWLGGLIDAAVLDRRIRAEAEERAKQPGFR